MLRVRSGLPFMSRHILLLREPSEAPDKYEAAFAAAAYDAVSVPVLETVLTNIPALSNALELDVAGIIITSARSVEAIARAAHPPKTAPFFVVGKATASALCHVFPHADIRGESSGNAEQLAHFIIDNLKDTTSATLLYLTGDKNRDTLPSILSPTFTLQTLKVYETRGSHSLPRSLLELHPTGRWWFVFFAPSAAEWAWASLQQYYDPSVTSVAAIGPTTSTFLKDKLGLSVNAVAASPSPQELLKAIIKFDAVSSRSNK